MFPKERHKYILKRISENEFVKVEDLSKELSVSTMTIHRDLNNLISQGLIEKNYGGAFLKQAIRSENVYSKRKEKNISEKKNIAKKALLLIENESVILLDAGTTNYELALLLSSFNDFNLTIITNDLKIAALLSENKNYKLILIGGEIEYKNELTCGYSASEFMSKLYADIAFIGTQSINNEMCLMTPGDKKIQLKQQYIKNSRIKVLVTDKSKFGQYKLYKIAELKDFDYVISNHELNETYKKYFTKHNIIYINCNDK